MIEVNVDTIHGPMCVFEDNAQYTWLKAMGASADDHLIERVRELLEERPRGAMIDAGACYGTWSMALADVTTHQHAFEPQVEVFPLMYCNTSNETCTRYCSALWSQKAWLSIESRHGKDGNFGTARIRPYAGKIPAVAIDEVIADDVSFIKIDVEGSEYAVIQGARRTISRCRPLMFIEYDHADSSEVGLRTLLEGMSYELEPLEGNFLCVHLEA